MQVLVFDTSLDKSYITLALQDSATQVSTFVSKKIINAGNRYHSAFLVSQIQEILESNIVDMENLDGIGVNVGPGSFTGIRVCLIVAKTMAQQLNTRLVGVSSMDILSKVYLKDEKILSPVVMDAKRNMFYAFDPKTDKKTELLHDDEMKDFLDKIDNDTKIICDSSSIDFLQNNGKNAISFERSNFELGEILAGITLARLKNVTKYADCHWSVVKPLYIQTPPVLG